jgi:hypothetical protein
VIDQVPRLAAAGAGQPMMVAELYLSPESIENQAIAARSTADQRRHEPIAHSRKS